MFTPKRFCRCTIASNCAPWLTQIRISGGSSDTDVNELAVMPCTQPGARSAVTTVTPVANCPRARRNSELVGVVGAIVEVFEDNTDQGQGRALASRIIMASGEREGVPRWRGQLRSWGAPGPRAQGWRTGSRAR